MSRLKDQHPVTGLHNDHYVIWGDSCYRVAARNPGRTTVLYKQEPQRRKDERREADVSETRVDRPAPVV